MTAPVPSPRTAKPLRTWRPMALGTTGILLALAVTFAFALTPLRVRYYSAAMTKPRSNGFYYARKMIECGPQGTRRVLQMWKTGSYDGDSEQSMAALLRMYARDDVSPQVRELFTDPDPRARAFAAYVAGHLRDERYLDGLRVLAADKTPLPSGWFQKSVADRAATAILWTTTPETPENVAGRKDIERVLAEIASGPPTYKGMSPKR